MKKIPKSQITKEHDTFMLHGKTVFNHAAFKLNNAGTLREDQVVAKWMPVLKKLTEASQKDWPQIAMYLETSHALFSDVGDFTRYVLPHLREMLAKKKQSEKVIPEYEEEVDNLSPAMLTFAHGRCNSKNYPKMTRFSLIMNTMSSLSRPTDLEELISDQALLMDKMHDREPALIIAELETRCPTFFDKMPRRDMSKPPTQDKKGQFLCNFVRHFYHQGKRKYQKPNLRQKTSDITTCE